VRRLQQLEEAALDKALRRQRERMTTSVATPTCRHAYALHLVAYHCRFTEISRFKPFIRDVLP